MLPGTCKGIGMGRQCRHHPFPHYTHPKGFLTMAVGAPPFPELPAIAGFQVATMAAGIKSDGSTDLLLVRMEEGTSVAGTFTANRVRAAPVELCRERLPGGRARGLLVNSGNANACNGEQGMKDARNLSLVTAVALGVDVATVFTSSTGVIGKALPVATMAGAIPGLTRQLAPGGWDKAARAIMTTDTFPKGVVRRFTLDGMETTLVGITKGAGMIHPQMATMLGYLFTDAAITPSAWQRLLERAVDQSFNRISVDGDTSTNDTVLAFASAMAGNTPITSPDDPRAEPLIQALMSACLELAQMIVRDGEGATKFITITVSAARTEEEARQVAETIASSPLVKTACFGNDPNWGRILAATGRSGVAIDPGRLQVWLGECLIVEQGGRAASYTEEAGMAVMAREELAIRVALGQGSAEYTVWTCDFSQEYVHINAAYRT